MSYLSTWLQQNTCTKPIYKTAKKIINSKNFSMQSLNVIQSYREAENKVRVNLVLPTLNKYKIFGGIATALKIYDYLGELLDADMRIIVIRQEKYNSKYSLLKEGYEYNTNSGSKQVIFMSDLDNKLAVREKDIFICTSWDTAYSFDSVMKWKKEVYGKKNAKMVYLIQDYEPGFYPWSTEYVLAESTYKNNSVETIALFNSKELYDFFELRGYQFYKKYYFVPNLNANLATFLKENNKEQNRKKRILIYGRPGTQRNVFELIVHSLRLWIEKINNPEQWEIISLGETFDDIDVGKNVKIRCLGKASLEEYAQMMLESYAGISLMASPHPSYPPLEMATFGIKVITNQFENKDLTDFNSNIVSLDQCTPEKISETLKEICLEYPNKIAEINTESSYVNDTTSLKDALEIIAKEFKN